jgi:hypothetical protein
MTKRIAFSVNHIPDSGLFSARQQLGDIHCNPPRLVSIFAADR